MGSSNSTPVEEAEEVQIETDSHEDMIELNFSHVTGASFVLIIAALSGILWCLCRRRRPRMGPLRGGMTTSFPLQTIYEHPGHRAPPAPFPGIPPVPMVINVSADDVMRLASYMGSRRRIENHRFPEREVGTSMAGPKNDDDTTINAGERITISDPLATRPI